jgi:hypothetical protein
MLQRSLPAELLMMVASCLSPCDLAHLCITSSVLLHIIRPILYRKVELKAIGYHSNASTVLQLLARDKPLARCVIELKLERCLLPGEKFLDEDPPRPRLIYPDALENMVSLKRVILYGPIFLSEFEQSEFARVFAPGLGIEFEELVYAADTHSPARGFPDIQLGDIGGLKKLYWHGDNTGTSPH